MGARVREMSRGLGGPTRGPVCDNLGWLRVQIQVGCQLNVPWFIAKPYIEPLSVTLWASLWAKYVHCFRICPKLTESHFYRQMTVTCQGTMPPLKLCFI
jgi:hypothetical protein